MSTSLAMIPRHVEPWLTRRSWGVALLLAVPAVLTLANLFWPYDSVTNTAAPATSLAVGGATTGGVAESAALTVAPAIEAEYRRAVHLFRSGRFAAAYGRFVRLADAGHAPSARIALVMVEQGRWLFGSTWDAWPHQLRGWAELASVPLPVTLAGATTE